MRTEEEIKGELYEINPRNPVINATEHQIAKCWLKWVLEGRWMNHTRLIQIVFAILFLVISTGSFALSYVNLMAGAEVAGIPTNLTWVWPLCIDAFLVMGSLFILQSKLQGENTDEGWFVVIIFTIISIFFNIAQSPEDWLSRAKHAVPPIALCWSLHMLMVRLNRDLKPLPLATSCYNREATGATEDNREVTEDEREDEETDIQLVTDRRRKVLSFISLHPEATTEDIRIALKMGWKTVDRIRQDLMTSGDLSPQAPSE